MVKSATHVVIEPCQEETQETRQGRHDKVRPKKEHEVWGWWAQVPGTPDAIWSTVTGIGQGGSTAIEDVRPHRERRRPVDTLSRQPNSIETAAQDEPLGQPIMWRSHLRMARSRILSAEGEQERNSDLHDTLGRTHVMKLEDARVRGSCSARHHDTHRAKKAVSTVHQVLSTEGPREGGCENDPKVFVHQHHKQLMATQRHMASRDVPSGPKDHHC